MHKGGACGPNLHKAGPLIIKGAGPGTLSSIKFILGL